MRHALAHLRARMNQACWFAWGAAPRRGRGVAQEFRRVASKGAPMGWVVKQWRLDTLERLLAESVRAELASTRATAERDARRARRAADRTSATAARELSELERVGAELRTAVRDWRLWLRDPAVEPAAAAGPDTLDPAPRDVAPSPAAAASPEAPAPAPRDVAPCPAAAASPAAPAPRDVAPPLSAAASPAAPEPPGLTSPPGPAASPRRRRPARASLHSSALTELFRATAAR
jgi:hypothetical protein